MARIECFSLLNVRHNVPMMYVYKAAAGLRAVYMCRQPHINLKTLLFVSISFFPNMFVSTA